MSAVVTVEAPDESPLYRVRCSECGSVFGSASKDRADERADAHRAEHADTAWPPKLERK